MLTYQTASGRPFVVWALTWVFGVGAACKGSSSSFIGVSPDASLASDGQTVGDANSGSVTLTYRDCRKRWEAKPGLTINPNVAALPVVIDYEGITTAFSGASASYRQHIPTSGVATERPFDVQLAPSKIVGSELWLLRGANSHAVLYSERRDNGKFTISMNVVKSDNSIAIKRTPEATIRSEILHAISIDNSTWLIVTRQTTDPSVVVWVANPDGFVGSAAVPSSAGIDEAYLVRANAEIKLVYRMPDSDTPGTYRLARRKVDGSGSVGDAETLISAGRALADRPSFAAAQISEDATLVVYSERISNVPELFSLISKSDGFSTALQLLTLGPMTGSHPVLGQLFSAAVLSYLGTTMAAEDIRQDGLHAVVISSEGKLVESPLWLGSSPADASIDIKLDTILPVAAVGIGTTWKRSPFSVDGSVYWLSCAD